MNFLYCIAGILPAQFRSSPVDCGVSWKAHAKETQVDVDPANPFDKDQTAVLTHSTPDNSQEYAKQILSNTNAIHSSIEDWKAAFNNLVQEEMLKTGAPFFQVEAAFKKQNHTPVEEKPRHVALLYNKV